MIRSSEVSSLAWAARLVLLAVLGLAGITPSLADTYRLQPGDTVSVSVYARGDLSGNYRIDDAGEIVVPLIGEIEAGGRTTREMRTALENSLRDAIGADIKVAVSVAEHRPVYVDGDVDRPGAYPYRPDMTVGKAMALAGGRHSLRTAGTLVSASREMETFSLLMDGYYRAVAREARLLSEDAGQESPSFPADLERSALNDPRVREILDNERQLMTSRNEAHASRTASLQQEIEALSVELSTIQAQKKSIDRKRALFQKQFDDIEKLAGKGIVPKATTLRLEITATSLDQEARSAEISLLRTASAGDEARRQIEDLAVTRNADIASQLQAVQDELAQARIRYDESRKRLAVLFSQTLPVSMLTEESDPPLVSIERAGHAEPIEADLEARLQPGDVIRVPWPEFSLPDIPDTRLPERAVAPVAVLPDTATDPASTQDSDSEQPAAQPGEQARAANGD